MGFKSKQVSSDDIDDDDSLNKITLLDNSTSTKNHDQEQQQQRADALDCPRCSSRNTKFCYYNNYNRSQPRHFCKDCKRYWTKGGTLRNVPAGCGRNRKNKRLKTLNSAKTTTTIATVPIPSSTANTNPHLPAQEGLKAVTDNDQKKISDFLFEAFSVDNTSPQHVIQNLSFSGGLGFNGQPSPIPGIYSSQLDSIGSSSITENYNNIFCQPLQGPEDASSHELTNWWNLNDLDTLISVDDLWDDTEEEINP